MAHSFAAYIDESGDDGLGPFRAPGVRGGSSSWLTLGATVVRYTNDLETVRWRDEILALMPEKKMREIHFSNMNHHQKIAASQKMASFSVRGICILSNKATIPAGTYSQTNQLYFYLARYLIERISWLCRDMRPTVPEGDGRVKITFSRRGGLSYGDFKDYMQILKNLSSGEVNIHWPVIDINGIDARDHSTNAGVQLADIIASAFACGVEPDKYGNCESRYAEILKPVTYHRKGNYLSYGAKMVPHHTDFTLTRDQARFIDVFK